MEEMEGLHIGLSFKFKKRNYIQCTNDNHKRYNTIKKGQTAKGY